MEFKELTIDELKNLSTQVKAWLMNVMYEDGLGVVNEDSLIEKFDEFINDYFPLFYVDGDWDDDVFRFDDEGGIIIVNGNIDAETMATYEITRMLITGNIVTDNFATQDSDIEIWGNVKVHSNLILSDTHTSLIIKGELETESVINVIDDENVAKYIEIGKILGKPNAFIAENSYSQMGNEELLKALGFSDIKELSEDDMNEIWDELY